MTPTRRRGGFTLVELAVAAAILAILAAVALPAYQSTVRKSRRADAITAMQSVQQAQERWRANNASYNASIGTGPAQISIGAASPATPEGYYTLALSAATATGYVVTATATTKARQDRDSACASMVLTYDAGATTLDPASCWAR